MKEEREALEEEEEEDEDPLIYEAYGYDCEEDFE